MKSTTGPRTTFSNSSSSVPGVRRVRRVRNTRITTFATPDAIRNAAKISAALNGPAHSHWLINGGSIYILSILLIDVSHSKVTKSRILSTIPIPMPFTSSNPSTLTKSPLASL